MDGLKPYRGLLQWQSGGNLRSQAMGSVSDLTLGSLLSSCTDTSSGARSQHRGDLAQVRARVAVEPDGPPDILLALMKRARRVGVEERGAPGIACALITSQIFVRSFLIQISKYA